MTFNSCEWSCRLKSGILAFVVLNSVQRWKGIPGVFTCFYVLVMIYVSQYVLMTMLLYWLLTLKYTDLRTVRAISSDRGKVVSGSDDQSVILYMSIISSWPALSVLHDVMWHQKKESFFTFPIKFPTSLLSIDIIIFLIVFLVHPFLWVALISFLT